MTNNFDYQSVPYGYAHCFNGRCPQSGSCLRHFVAENCTSQYPTLSIINPNCIPADAPCPYFKEVRTYRMAWGIKHLLDKVPYEAADEMRRQLIAHFGKNTYYRFYRLERPLRPEDQEFVCRLFQRKGIAEAPRFERYSEEYYFD